MKTSYSSLPISKMKDGIYHRGSNDSGANDDDNDDNLGGIHKNNNRVVNNSLKYLKYIQN